MEKYFAVISIGAIRWIVVFSLLPVFSGGYLPQMIRMLLASSMSLLTFETSLSWYESETHSSIDIVLIIMGEVSIGLIIGLPLALLLEGFHFGAGVVAQMSGMAFASTDEPVAGSSGSPIERIFGMILLTWFFVCGPVEDLLLFILTTVDMWPVSSTMELRLPTNESFTYMLEIFSAISLKVCLPFLLVFGTIDAALGIAGRFSPQLQVFFLGSSLKTFFVILVTMILLNPLTDVLTSEFRKVMEHVLAR